MRKLKPKRVRVFYWPCATWCFEEDLLYYLSHLMSGGYSEITVNEGVDIDALVALLTE